ncbi:uncharacterized protein LOC110876090 [Helianthus annuus]|uniref:uncharacterized protein LOC110876090 n=1 Tax=Helianthus annuus TaxID=4232 RepID=UPI000B8F3009|nr:uncharacterized protein LOC110876090 [Helianthus annuus]
MRWDKFLKPKVVGGVGLGSISSFNLEMLSKWWWRFRDNPSQLWASEVSAIHKNKGDKSLILNKKTLPGVWKDIGSLDKVLLGFGISITGKLRVTVGDGALTRFWKDAWLKSEPLAVVYPDLYRLVAEKDASVKDNAIRDGGGCRWGWRWLRNSSTSAAWNQVTSLMGLLNGVQLNSARDTWVWENERGDGFSVKCIRREIDAASGQNSDEMEFKWNSWATAKSNFLLRRALFGKVASKVELGRRGVPLHDVTCDRCGLKAETSDHVFAECLFAKSIWWNVCAWLKVSFPHDCSMFRDLIKHLLDCPGDAKWRRLVLTVVMATVWRLWHARNTKTFEGTFIPVVKTVDLIKEDAFIWLKQRSNLLPLPWEKWLLFDVANIL